MPADPVIWNPETKPGYMTHTFKGLRTQFPNRGMHYVVQDKIIPLRKHLISRSEAKSPARWQPALATLVMAGLESIHKALQEVVQHDDVGAELPTLDQRLQAQNAFIELVKAKTTTLEALSARPDASTSDKLAQPPDSRVAVLQFDWIGETDPNMAQPTPGRVSNTDMQAVLIELDGLIVKMSQSPSADQEVTINSYDMALFATHLANMYEIVKRAVSPQDPYLPGINRGQLDSTFDADGKFDNPLNAGAGGAGELVNSPPTPAATP